jgi:glucokinase
MMCDLVRAAAASAGVTLESVDAIGVAAPGPVDLTRGVMLEPPNLKPWRDVPVRDTIGAEFGKPTAFQNDANAAAMGECWVGAGRGCRSFVLFTLGTGIGGGIVLDGRLLEGAHGHGGELGHVKIVAGGRPCACGRQGCLEAYANAGGVVARMREALAAGQRPVDQWRGEFTAEDVFAAAKAGDEIASEVVAETARLLGLAAANVMHVIDPEVIAFGGGMADAGTWFLDAIRQSARDNAFPVPAQRCEIRLAELGARAGIIGAAACARQLTEP